MNTSVNKVCFVIRDRGLVITVEGEITDAELLKVKTISPAFITGKLLATIEYGEFLKVFGANSLMSIRELVRAICKTYAEPFVIRKMDLEWTNGPDVIALA